MEKIPFHKSTWFPPLFNEYTSLNEKLEPLYAFKPTIEGVQGAISQREFTEENRAVLVNTLLEQYKAVKDFAGRARNKKLSLDEMEGSTFTISNLERTITIQDNSGSKAVETQKHAVVTNQSGLSEFWCKNINSNGFVSQITINGTTPAEQLQEDKNTHAAIKFDGNLKSGQTFDIELSFNHKDAFKNTQCILAHTVDNETNLLRLVVNLPGGRPVTSASVSCKVDDIETPQLPPVITDNRNVVAEIRNPLIGATYYLQWDCPRQNLVDKLDRIFATK